ncbi:MAG: cupin domain-containing protein [Desulfobacteraceae bacterium]|nr:cupin domain-containing protein [Desulfobacteraceae bacterium]
MESKEIAACMANGIIACFDKDMEAGVIEWNEHPKFKGVFLKHLIKGADTDGQLSCHIVKVDPGCMLDEHIHEGEWELHEVIEGHGNGIMNSREIPYHPGRMTVIPKSAKHKVVAGSDGLTLLAKFFPALL